MGDLVSVLNDHGAFEAAAEVSETAMSGVVTAPMGYWPRNTASNRTVNAIDAPAYGDYGHAPTFSDTRVAMRNSTRGLPHSTGERRRINVVKRQTTKPPPSTGRIWPVA